MNTLIIIGYTNTHGLSGGKIIAGPGISTQAESETIMENARDLHKFPEGYKRVDLFMIERPEETHSFISEDVAHTVQNAAEAAAEAQVKARSKMESERAGQKNFTAAHNVFQAAAKKRNAAVGAVASQVNILTGLTEDKERASTQARIDKLQPLADEATADFNKVLEQFNVVRNPKATTEEKQAALVALGVVKVSA
jgi:hypothetical protein